jgi:hypothetical protein
MKMCGLCIYFLSNTCNKCKGKDLHAVKMCANCKSSGDCQKKPKACPRWIRRESEDAANC